MEQVTKTNTNKNSKNTNSAGKSNVNGATTSESKKISLKIFIIVITIAVILISAGILTIVFQAIMIGKLKENMGQTFLNDGIVNVEENTSNVIGFSMLNNIISGVAYPQKVEVDCKNIINPQVLRVKSNVVNSDSKVLSVNLETTSAWVKGDDEYYYYNGVVGAPMKFLLCDKVVLPLEFSIQTNNKNKHVLIINIESLRHDNALINLAWNSAPEDWLSNYAS